MTTRCLHQLQPTAAVAGLPRRAALDFITAMNLFTAMVRRFRRLSVAGAKRILRGAAFGEIEQRTLRLYAGAGIVSGSDRSRSGRRLKIKRRDCVRYCLQKHR
jgi:menaquinone-specific isochorismate synthase